MLAYHVYWGYNNLVRGARINTPSEHRMVVFVFGFFGVFLAGCSTGLVYAGAGGRAKSA